MCEKRTRKIKKGSYTTRLREARRLQRLHRMEASASSDESNPSTPPPVDKFAQNRLILELALRTVALMQKNRIIQQKIIDLQKETTEFASSVMGTPEKNKQYMDQIRFYSMQQQQMSREIQNLPLKIQPLA